MKNNILRALLSLGLAVLLWSFAVTTVSTNADMKFENIPVVMQGETLLHELGFMVTGVDISEVTLRLEGSRKNLDKLSVSDIRVTVDVSKNPVAGTHALTYSVSYGADFDQSAFSVLSREPGIVNVTLEPKISKKVPVSIDFEGNVANEFMADKENVILDYTEITITGPQSEIDRIHMAKVTVDVEGRNETITEQFGYTLCDADGNAVQTQLVSADVEQVNLTLKIMRIKEIVLVANIIDGGGATGKNTTVTVAPETIWVSGSDTLLENLEELEVCALNLGEIPENQTFTFPIKLPEGIFDETGVTEATVTVEFNNLETKTLTVRNITAENVPDGMKAELLTKALEVQIRGPVENLELITEDSVSATVDFSETELGAVKMKATIIITDPNVGAVGSYTVSATVKQDNS